MQVVAGEAVGAAWYVAKCTRYVGERFRHSGSSAQ